MSTRIPTAVQDFADLLIKTSLSSPIALGNQRLTPTRGVSAHIQYNNSTWVDELLQNTHKYTFQLKSQAEPIQLSLQLYLNNTHHYRLFCFTRVGAVEGMAFSLNLTTQQEGALITLQQRIAFTERLPFAPAKAQALRRQKQAALCTLLQQLGYRVAGTTLHLGQYDTKTKQLLGTTPEKFLQDLVTVSLLKGHYQGNKGYVLDLA